MEVVALIPDLFFQARVAAAARAAGRPLRFVSDPGDLGETSLVLVDLDAAPEIGETIAALRRRTSAPIVVFGPHVDTERRKEARRAGADRVLAKSKFVTELPRIMQEDRTQTNRDIEAILARFAEDGRRMEDLGKKLQDRNAVAEIYFAPAPHMETTGGTVLDSADYEGFLAVETLNDRLNRLRALLGQGGWTPQSAEE
ncbi:MAG TPA: hypothetical protein VFA78_07345 [Chloroflexota bacterium]|nr:hypothetical protein [Chloroflexota bacterium]